MDLKLRGEKKENTDQVTWGVHLVAHCVAHCPLVILQCAQKKRNNRKSDNQELWLQQAKPTLYMLRIISEVVGCITLLVLDQPKYHGAVNAGIKDSHGGGSSTRDQASPPWCLFLDNKGNSWPEDFATRQMSGSLSPETDLTLESIQYRNSFMVFS